MSGTGLTGVMCRVKGHRVMTNRYALGDTVFRARICVRCGLPLPALPPVAKLSALDEPSRAGLARHRASED